MRTRGRWAIGWGALALVACAGGQSGSEGQPDTPACSLTESKAIGLDEQTPYGTPREVFDRATSAQPQSAGLRWYPADGTSSSVDTTVTLYVSGAATSATLDSSSDPNCSPLLEVDGAILHFQTADGAFNEAIAGTLDSGFLPGLNFNGYPAAFAGTYDVTPATRQFEHPRIWLTTSLFPPKGFVGVGEESSTKWVQIATWAGTPAAGAGGRGTAGTGEGGTAGAGEGGAAGNAELTGGGGMAGSGG